jgi:hypothetical protein
VREGLVHVVLVVEAQSADVDGVDVGAVLHIQNQTQH